MPVDDGLYTSAKRVMEGDVKLLTRSVKHSEDVEIDDGVDWGITVGC